MDDTVNKSEPWHPGKMKPELLLYAWTYWAYQWEAHQAGEHRVLVPAIDETREPQSSIEQPPFPNHASGLYEVIVTVQ